MPLAIDLDQLRWQDVVDVALLTFLLWQLHRRLRGTLAVRVVLGLGVVAAAGVAAHLLGLVLLGAALKALGAVAALIVVVVFQGEIRRGLGRLDPLAWWRARRGGAADLDRSRGATLADAAFALARARIGALIVLPGRDPIDDHLTGGTRLDAALSPALLEAIFHTGSPLHDGAIVLDRGVRIAGAVLPLTTRLDVPDAYGTRHRAALGLSEACDATVVVVSEERGIVSLVRGGAVEELAAADALRARLDAAGGDAGARGRRRPLADLASLVAIGVLVTIAWFAIAGAPGAEVIRVAEIELREVPELFEADLPEPATVRIHLRGPRPLLLEVDEGSIAAWIDLGKAKLGNQRVEVHVDPPPGIDVVKIVPPQVRVRLREVR